MGTTQFLVGAAVMALVGLFLDGSALPMVAGIGLCAASALAMALLTLGVRQRRR